MKFYTTTKFGPKQEMTPEGFLICRDVPINRIGVMLYGPGETPIQVGKDGIARIEREADEVFRPETIASFAGKPVVDEHPSVDVSPANWKDLAVGFVMDPRRGVGALDDTLLADFVITVPEAIEAVRNGKREVSCGYDADYIEISEGRGRQTNILGNHVALVDSGRCGPRCAIGDEDTLGKEKDSMTLKEKILNAFKKKDEGALTAVLDELPEGDEKGTSAPVVHVHNHVADAKTSDACDRSHDDDDDDDRKTRDAAIVDTVFGDKRFTDLKSTVDKIADAVAQDKDDEEEEEDDNKTHDDDDDDDDDDRRRGRDEAPPFGLEAPPGTGDHAKARDSAFMEESFQETVALAEIIVPGVKVPTFDAKAKPKKTFDALCTFRRRVLDQAYNVQPDTRDFMDEILHGRELSKLKCDKVRDVFIAVGSMKRRQNTQDMGRTSSTHDSGRREEKKPLSIAEVNKRNSDFYKGQQ